MGILFVYLLINLTELFSIFLCIEGISLTIIALLCMNYTHENALQAAGAYYILGAVPTFCALTGLSFLYGGLHSLNIFVIQFLITSKGPEYLVHFWAITLGIFCIVLMFLYKLGVYPFQY